MAVRDALGYSFGDLQAPDELAGASRGGVVGEYFHDGQIRWFSADPKSAFTCRVLSRMILNVIAAKHW